jgi:hypothetical protein
MKKSIGTFLIALVGSAAGFGIMRYMTPQQSIVQIL